jgi:hypothetical protein
MPERSSGLRKGRPPKKTDSIEVRLPDETKRAFMARCREQGRSASEVVRGFIDDFLAAPESRPRKASHVMTMLAKPAAIAAAGAAILFASTIVPSAVSAAPDLRAAFSRLDRDGDDTVSFAEFARQGDGDRFFVNRDAAPAATDARPFVIPLGRGVPPPPGMAVAPPEPMLRAEFGRQDADASGQISFDEYFRFHMAMLRGGFDTYDRDRSGGIDAAEFAAALDALPQGLARPAFADLDRNRDGRIQFDEFTS